MITSLLPAHHRQNLRAFGKFTFHCVLPPRCMSCDTIVAQSKALCSKCWAEMALIERPVCEVTGRPLSFDLGSEITSAEAIENPPNYRKARAPTLYSGTASKLVLALKYYDRLDLAYPMGRMMVKAASDILNSADVIIPVPLHRRRLYSRRFNQAAELAKVVATKSGKHLAVDALTRIRETRQQTKLDIEERERNVLGAFRVRPEKKIEIHGRRVVIIDDVLTTGATVNACARTLLRENATYVDVITFAKVVDLDSATI